MIENLEGYCSKFDRFYVKSDDFKINDTDSMSQKCCFSFEKNLVLLVKSFFCLFKIFFSFFII